MGLCPFLTNALICRIIAQNENAGSTRTRLRLRILFSKQYFFLKNHFLVMISMTTFSYLFLVLQFSLYSVNYQATGYQTGIVDFTPHAINRRAHSILERSSSIFSARKFTKKCRIGAFDRVGSLGLNMAEYMFGMEGISLQPGDRTFIVGVDIKRDK